jgi:hypothetical protein
LLASLADASVTHVLVTNADNGYHPNFFKTLISCGAEVAGCDFTHNSGFLPFAFQKGRMDLGGVIVRADLLRTNGVTFIGALPTPTVPHHVHDNDYWFFSLLIHRLQATSAISHTVEFYHQ